VVQHGEEELLFVAEGRVQTAPIDAHSLKKILNGGRFIAALPEHGHSPGEDFVSVKLFDASHALSHCWNN
jgi:hypothetical protein